MKIPFLDLNKHHESIRQEINEAINRVISNSNFTLGQEVQKFEEEFANYCNVQHAAGVDNGTSALELSLRALNIGINDEVITTPNTFIAVAIAIACTGAKPVFVDINPETQNLDYTQLEAKITPNTKAIIPIHLFGQPADMDPILEIANKHNIPIIEDSAQAHGARYKGKRVSNFGTLSCFSFYVAKNLGALGDAGMVVSNNEELIDKIKLLRNYAQREKNVHEFIAYNKRLDALQAAILRAKLPYLDQWNKKRRQVAEWYNKHLPNNIIKPKILNDSESVYHLYVIRTENRNEIIEKLKQNEIGYGIHYPTPIHLQPAFNYLNYKEGSFPVTEEHSKQILSLPIFPELTEEQVIKISNSI